MFRRKRKTSDFSAEIEAHIQHEIERLRDQGLSEEDAHATAHQAFGNVTRAQEQFHESTRWLWFDNLWRDLRFAARVLRKSPGFTAVAVVTLAVAIGANAVVFGVLNALILRPLNLPDEQSLYMVEHGKDKDNGQSYPDYVDLRDRNRSFDGLAAFAFSQVAIDTGENPSRAWVYKVTGNYFDVVGIQPFLGRFLRPADERGANSAPYVVLTYAYWHSHFQDDHGVVGRSLQVNKKPYSILGVTPPGFHGTFVAFSPAMFIPMVESGQSDLGARGNRWIDMTIGHLKAGVSPAQAITDLNSIGSYLEKTYPKDDANMVFALARPGLFGDSVAPAVKAFMAGLMLLAGLILLAACANLGSLFAARAADRSREVAVRLALGAGRLRILRQLFTESVLISLMGGALGLWASVVVLNALSVWQPFPRYAVSVSVAPDVNVYGVALLLALVSGFLFGAVPVRQILRTDPYLVIKTGSMGKVGRRLTARDLLLGAQIAICAVLITSSMVAIRGFVRTLNSNFGFQPHDAMLVEIDLDMAGYKDDAASAMQARMFNALKAIPGVESVGVSNSVPLQDCCDTSDVFADNATDLTPGKSLAEAFRYRISPEYFQAAGTTLLAGRAFTLHDDKNAPAVAVVNRFFASKVFGSAANAVGKYYKYKDGMRIQVVGIVEDGKYNTIGEDQQAAVFRPLLQSPSSGTTIVVRSSRDPLQLATAIRNALQDLDSGLPFFIESWTKVMNDPLFATRMATMSLGVMGVMGAMLSITGVFGMAAYSVSKRKKELGIRMALGAQSRQVLQAALGRAFKLLAFGSAAGLILGIMASKVLASIVFQATPSDPLVLIGVVLAMMLVGLLATWIPAQRALSLDPVTLLREE